MNERTRQQYFFMASIAYQADRLQESLENIVRVVRMDPRLTQQQMHKLFAIFLSTISQLKVSRSSLLRVYRREEDSKKISLIRRLKIKIESQIQGTSKLMINLLDSLLIPVAESKQRLLVYLDKKGVHLANLAEIFSGSERDQVSAQVQSIFETALNEAKRDLSPAHHIRLGIVFNYCCFLYYLKLQKISAKKLARQECQSAISLLHTLDGEEWRASVMLTGLLRDNFPSKDE